MRTAPSPRRTTCRSPRMIVLARSSVAEPIQLDAHSPSGAMVATPAVGDEAVPSPSFWLCAGTLWLREVRGFYRERSRIVGSLSAPLLIWFVLGSGFGSSMLVAQGGYAQFFFPGTLALAVLFTSIFANISLIEDRREGFLLGVLVAPVSRLSLVLGKVCGPPRSAPSRERFCCRWHHWRVFALTQPCCPRCSGSYS